MFNNLVLHLVLCTFIAYVYVISGVCRRTFCAHFLVLSRHFQTTWVLFIMARCLSLYRIGLNICTLFCLH